MKRVFSAAFALLASAQFAQAEIWVCDIQQNASNGGWIPSTLVMGFDEGCDEVCIGIDNIPVDAPIEGRIATENAQRTTVAFRVNLIQDAIRQTANLDFRASLFRARGTVSVSMIPLGYANRFRASGTCAQQS